MAGVDNLNSTKKMKVDDETTPTQLHVLLVDLGFSLSLLMILPCQLTLRWTFRRSASCELTCEANQIKRLEWAHKYKNDDFANVVFTGETTVQ